MNWVQYVFVTSDRQFWYCCRYIDNWRWRLWGRTKVEQECS